MAAFILAFIAVLMDQTESLLYLGSLFTLAALLLYSRDPRSRKNAILVHVLCITLVVHVAQALRFMTHEVSWLREIVPLTTTLMGLGYLTWILVPRKKANPVATDVEVTRLLFEKVDQHLRSTELYRDGNLTLGVLAEAHDLPTYLVSQAIDHYAGRFNDYINGLRVRAFMRSYRPHGNVEALANRVGFNSRSAFYRAFKAETGKTPSQYFLKPCPDLQIRT